MELVQVRCVRCPWTMQQEKANIFWIIIPFYNFLYSLWHSLCTHRQTEWLILWGIELVYQLRPYQLVCLAQKFPSSRGERYEREMRGIIGMLETASWHSSHHLHTQICWSGKIRCRLTEPLIEISFLCLSRRPDVWITKDKARLPKKFYMLVMLVSGVFSLQNTMSYGFYAFLWQ